MNIETCLPYLEDLAKAKPRYPDIWNNIGLILGQLKRNTEALEALDKALLANPQYVDAGLNRCFMLGEVGKVEEGFGDFRRLHARSPDEFKIVLAMGVFCMRHGWRDAGLAQLLRAEMMRPDAPFVLGYCSAALSEASNTEEAQNRLRKARKALQRLKVGPTIAEHHSTIGDAGFYSHWENFSAVDAHLILADFLCARGDLDAAETELLTANCLFPGHVQTMVEYGKIMVAKERFREAMDWFSSAIQVDPTCHQAWYELSFLYTENNNLDEAVNTLRKALDLRPLFPDYCYHLGNLLLEIGKRDEAIRHFRQALILKPGYGHAALQLASAYLERDQPDEALAVLDTNPCADWPEALVLSAQAHLKRGQWIDAQKVLEQVMSLDEDNSDAQNLLDTLKVNA